MLKRAELFIINIKVDRHWVVNIIMKLEKCSLNELLKIPWESYELIQAVISVYNAANSRR